MKILIIIPAYNEAKYIIECLTSLSNQSFKATEVIVVDDLSTDETPILATEFCNNNIGFNYLKKIIKDKKGHQPGAKIVEAFLYGLLRAKSNYDVVCKFDADLIFPKNYLEKIKLSFEANPSLGMFGGFCTIQKNGTWKIENLTNEDHIRGALKAYKKDCYQAIGGIRPYMGWDSLDELLTYYNGWKIATDKSLLVKHMKPTASNYKKKLPALFGKSCYQIGYDFGLCFLASLKMAIKKNELSFLYISCKSFLKSRKELLEVIVTSDEQKFICNYRWSKVKEKFKLG